MIPSTSAAPPTFPAPALFLEPESRDFGQRFFGQRGFGGILEDWSSPNPDGSTRWIPQYNLQNFWRRQIAPYPIGLIEPLIPSRIKKSNDFHRLPGHFSYRTSEFELYNRNLLATKFYEESGILKIWTVNERSKRRLLECFSVEIDHSGTPLSNTLKQVSKRKLNLIPPTKSDTEDIELITQKSSEPLLELRMSHWSNRLFLRTPTLLRALDDDSDQEIAIFHVAVKSFSESHLIPGNLTVVDYGGRIWMTDSLENSNFRKVSVNEEEVYQQAIFTDHPKILGISANFHFETVDTRGSGSSRACMELWRSPEFEVRGHREPLYVQERAPNRAVIRHVLRVPGTANNYLVMTDRALMLIDDRFPGKAVLTVRHSFPTGTHRMLVTEPVKDEKDGGEVYSILGLEQLPVINSSISMTKIYRHPSGIWSSTDSFHSIGDPEDFNNITRRGKYAETPIIEEPTRALSLVDFSAGNLKNSAFLLLRQTDDGAIWWQKFSKNTVSEKEKVEEERKSFERIVEIRKNEENWRREGWRPVYSDRMNEQIREDPGEHRPIVCIDSPGMDRRTISRFHQRAVNAHRKWSQLDVSRAPVTLDVMPLDDVNSVLSKITLDTWKATEDKIKEMEE